MQCKIRYTTFEGAAGYAHVALENIPHWLSNRPGTAILSIVKIGSMDECAVQRSIEKQALREFAEGILRNC